MEADLIHCLNEWTKGIELRIIYSRNFISTVSHKFEVFFPHLFRDVLFHSNSFFILHESKSIETQMQTKTAVAIAKRISWEFACAMRIFHVIMYFIRVNDVITIVVFAWEARWTFNFKIGFFVESKNTTFWIGTFKCSVEISGKFSR